MTSSPKMPRFRPSIILRSQRFGQPQVPGINDLSANRITATGQQPLTKLGFRSTTGRTQNRAFEQNFHGAAKTAPSRFRSLGGVKPVDVLAAKPGWELLKRLAGFRTLFQRRAQVGGNGKFARF